MYDNRINIEDNENLMPLDESSVLACFGLLLDDEIDDYVKSFNYISQAFKGDIDFGFIDHHIKDDDLQIIKNSIGNSEYIIFHLLVKDQNIDSAILSELNKIVASLSDTKKSILITNVLSLNNVISTNAVIYHKELNTDSFAASIIHLSGKSTDTSLLHN